MAPFVIVMTTLIVGIASTDDAYIKMQNGEVANEDTAHEVPMVAWDDVTGAALDPDCVRQAREEEIQYARKKNVWTKLFTIQRAHYFGSNSLRRQSRDTHAPTHDPPALHRR